MGDAWRGGEGTWLPEALHMAGRGLRLGKLSRRALADITRLVVHHTGVGVLGRYKRDAARFGWTDPLEAAVHVYTRIMASSGHFVVGYRGEVVQFVPLEWVAWHAGYGGARKRSNLAQWYARRRYSGTADGVPRWFGWQGGRYVWWKERWWDRFGYWSPCVWFPDLDVNGPTLGIELLAVGGRDPYPREQVYGGAGGPGLVGLVRELAQRCSIPVDVDHVLTHSDTTPTARTTRGGRAWDPPPEKYRFEGVSW